MKVLCEVDTTKVEFIVPEDISINNCASYGHKVKISSSRFSLPETHFNTGSYRSEKYDVYTNTIPNAVINSLNKKFDLHYSLFFERRTLEAHMAFGPVGAYGHPSYEDDEFEGLLGTTIGGKRLLFGGISNQWTLDYTNFPSACEIKSNK